MTKNMGNTDKFIRLLIAVVLIGLYFANILTGTLGIVALIVATIFALTSLISFCPLYSLFGINTCKVKST